MDDLYNLEQVKKCLLPLDNKVFFYEKTSSTMTEAKNLILKEGVSVLDKALFIAKEQTQGKGRLGRYFYSPSENGVYFSFIYVDDKIINPGLITSVAAVSVCKAIKIVYNVDCKIKWVNDIFYNNKKICGILTEGIINSKTGKIDCAVIGIGINIFVEESLLSEELKNVVGGIIKKEDKRNQALLISEVIKSFFEIYDKTNLQEEKIINAMKEYKNLSMLIGKDIIVKPVINDDSKNYECKVIDIDLQGRLIVKTKDNDIVCLESGEVSVGSASLCN